MSTAAHLPAGGHAHPHSPRIPGQRTRRRVLLAAKIAIATAALITLIAVQRLDAFSISLFLVVGQGLVIVGALLAAFVIATDFFRRRGVAEVSFTAGETVFRQGEPGDLVYVIVSGEAEAVREEPDGEERVLARMGPGEYFGEMALISHAPRSATVRALTRLEAVTMGRSDFTTLYAHLPGLRQNVESVMKVREKRRGRSR